MSKITSVVVALLLVASCSHESKKQLSITRDETDGILNVAPVTINVDGRLAGCLNSAGILNIPVSSGTHAVRIEYFNPYRDREHPYHAEITVAVTSAEAVVYIVPDSSSDTAHSGEWHLQQASGGAALKQTNKP